MLPEPPNLPPTPRGPVRRMAMGAGVSSQRGSSQAAEEAVEACGQALADSGGGACDLAIVMVSPHHVSSMAMVTHAVSRRLSPKVCIGCSAESVIGGDQEFEGLPGISILAGSMPGVGFTPFCSDDLPPSLSAGGEASATDDDDLSTLADAVGMTPAHRGTLLFVEPFTTPLMNVIAGLARARALCSPGGAGTKAGPGVVGLDPEGQIVGSTRRSAIVGGICSAARGPGGGNAMILNDRVITEGVVGVSLSGQVRIDAVVSQGCRPLGPPMVVTSAKGQVIRTLGGKPAIDCVHAAISTLPESQRQTLLSRGLMIGRVVDEYKDHFGPGDYLIRAVTGVNREEHSILTSERVRVGQTVRFHVRDAETAEADLGMLMDAQALHGRPAGALLVSCNQRGTRLFGRKDRDAQTVQRAFRDPIAGERKARPGEPIPRGERLVPLAGMFGAGEIGPIGDGVFLHGQTACVALIREA